MAETEKRTIPSYLFEEIDIIKDSVIEMCEKIAFKAHGGVYIEGLWEAPAPAFVNPVRQTDVDNSDTNFMEFRSVPKTTPYVGRSGRKLSTKVGWAPRKFAEEFHGYKSDAPAGKLFKEDEPIGAIAKATKAVGELAAIANKKGEDEKPAWELLEKTWDIDAKPIKDYVMPDVTETSEMDIIKFDRSTSHQLYGFDENTPSVTISMGHYRRDTIAHNVYIDWHRIAISLRWMGEYICKYNPAVKDIAKKQAVTMYFAPAFREMPRVIGAPIIPQKFKDAVTKYIPDGNNAFADLANTTMRYFTNTIKNYESFKYMQSKHTIIANLDPEIWSPNVAREVFASRRPKQSRLPLPSQMKMNENVDYYLDLHPNKKPRENILLTASKISKYYPMKAVTVLRLLLECHYRANLTTKVSNELRAMLDWEEEEAIDPRFTVKGLMSRFIKLLPDNIGNLLYNILNWGAGSTENAQKEFLNLLYDLNPTNIKLDILNKNTLLLYSIRETTNHEFLIRILNRAILNAAAAEQSAGSIIIRPNPGMSLETVLTQAIDHYIDRKLKFWTTQYAARVETASRILAKNPDMNTKRINKVKAITYSFLKVWYSSAQFRIKGMFDVEIYWPADWTRKWITDNVKKYVRKRKRMFNEAEVIDRLVEGIVSKNRIRDILEHADRCIHPDITYSSLYTKVVNKTHITVKSIQATLKLRFSGLRDNAIEDEADDEMVDETEYYANFPDGQQEVVVEEKVVEDPMAEMLDPMDELFGDDPVPAPIPETIEIDPIADLFGDYDIPKEPEPDVIDEFDDLFADSETFQNDQVLCPTVNLRWILQEDFGIHTTKEAISEIGNIPIDKVEKYPVKSVFDRPNELLQKLSGLLTADETTFYEDFSRHVEDLN